MEHDTCTLHQLECRRVAHKFWRTLLHYLMACPLQLSPIPNRHSSPTLQVIVTLHKSVDLLIPMDSETMRGGVVVYWLCYIDTVYLFFCLCIVLSIWLNVLLSEHVQYLLTHIVCHCPFDLNLLHAKTVQWKSSQSQFIFSDVFVIINQCCFHLAKIIVWVGGVGLGTTWRVYEEASPQNIKPW